MKLRLQEAKSIEAERLSSWSSIPEEVFNQIIALDPQTDLTANRLGPAAKQLLLPKYVAGETSFLDRAEAVTSAIEHFVDNRQDYEIKNFMQFPSVESFVNYVNGPQNTEIGTQELPKESKIDKIYRQYYSDIDRASFDRYIALDPQTNLEKDVVGEYAKNLLLPLCRKGGLDGYSDEEITKAIQAFEEHKPYYNSEQLSLSKYNSFAEFAEVAESGSQSNFLSHLKQEGYIGSDIRYLGSTLLYDVFEALTPKGNAILAGAEASLGGPGLSDSGYSNSWSRNAYGHWCTSYASSYWNNTTYRGPHGENKYYIFIYKPNPLADDRARNYQLAVTPEGVIVSNADGVEHWGNDRRYAERLFGEDPEVLKILAKDSTHGGLIDEVVALKFADSYADYVYTGDASSLLVGEAHVSAKIIKSFIKKLTISSAVTHLPAMLFANCTSLTSIVFEEGLQSIGPQAFKGCLVLKELSFPSTLQSIGSQAFMNCTSLSRTLRLPDSVTRIGRDAFKGTHATISIQKDRPLGTLRIDPADMEWFDDHVTVVNENLLEDFLDENIPTDLKRAYQSAAYRRGTSNLGHAVAPAFGDRRATPYDYHAASYDAIDSQEAFTRIRQNPSSVDHLRALYGDQVLELDLKENGKFYPLVVPDNQAFIAAMVRAGCHENTLPAARSFVRSHVAYPGGLRSILDQADKLYWTDEYEHLIDGQSDIATRRANNATYAYYYPTSRPEGTPRDNAFKWVGQDAAAVLKVLDTGNHNKNTTQRSYLAEYQYYTKALAQLERNREDYDLEEYIANKQKLKELQDDAYDTYLTFRKRRKNQDTHAHRYDDYALEINHKILQKLQSLQNLAKEATAKAETLRTLQNTLASAEAELLETDPAYKEYQQQLAEKAQDLTACHEQIQQCEADINQAEQRIAELRRQIAEEEARIERSHSDIEATDARAAEIRGNINYLASLADDVAEAAANRNSDSIAEVETAIEDIQTWFNAHPAFGKKFSQKKHKDASDAARAMLAPEEPSEEPSEEARD